MHVLINAASANMGGAVTYLNNVLKWLPELAPEDKFIIIAPESTLDKFKKFQVDGQVILQRYPHKKTGGLARMFFDQVSINQMTDQKKIDLVFSSTGFGTFYCNRPQVLLVRNPVYFSKDFHQNTRNLVEA